MSAMFASAGDAESKRKADVLAQRLTEMGLPARVEPRGTLAVIQVSASIMARLAEPEVRRAVLALAREQEAGFTHVAVELAAGSADGDAALRRP
jgi:hypothetical protein